MLRVIVIISLLATVFAQISPVVAGESREGVPGRRTGGGTRWAAPRANRSGLLRSNLAASAFASRTQVPMQLDLRAFFTNHTG